MAQHILHLYVPKNFGDTFSYRRSLLLGNYAISGHDRVFWDSDKKFPDIVRMSIYGACQITSCVPATMDICASLTATTPGLDKEELPQVVGSFGPAKDTDLLKGRVRFASADELRCTAWVEFDEEGTLTTVLLNGQRISLDSVLIFVYSPRELARCILMAPRAGELGLANQLVRSFELVAKIPVHEIGGSDQGFVRFLPYIKLEPDPPGSRSRGGSRSKRRGRGQPERIKGPVETAALYLCKEGLMKARNCSAGVDQLIVRVSTIWDLVSKPQKSRLPVLNFLSFLLIDAALGMIFSTHLQTYPHVFGILQNRVEGLLQLVLDLLDWLHGDPAGLKLNMSLSSLLWRFFSYHMHLWRNYIGILQPLLSILLSLIISSGFLGLTFQVALIKDLLSAVTFHIYCLYIYAARLFNVELCALKSLGRLFIGRKWNPLRHRIDTVHLSHSEIFLSSFGFTVAIFLAPTVVVYYTVFLFLRLPVAILSSLLTRLISFANTLEIASAVLLFFDPSILGGEIYFLSPTLDPSNAPILLEIKIQELNAEANPAENGKATPKTVVEPPWLPFVVSMKVEAQLSRSQTRSQPKQLSPPPPASSLKNKL